MDFLNLHIAVLGAGVEGTSAAEFLRKRGARVTVFDKDPFPDLSSFDMVVRSPGIRPDKVARPTTTATNLFFDLCPCPVIGVTGTKGKGTTATLIYEILKQDGKDVYLGGNIGIPQLSFLDQLTHDTVVVLELSSFQLIDYQHSPHIAVVLMIVPEHQDWHKSVEEYVEAKYQILRRQTADDFSIVCIDYPLNRSILSRIPGRLLSVSTIPHTHPGVCVTTRGTFVYQTPTQARRIFSTKDLVLPGRHNWENVAAAIAATKAYGVKTSSIRRALERFSGLPYRLEKVGVVDGVTYYNDSFSTTPETAIAAIQAFDAPKVLILGGSTKHSDFRELGRVISESSSIRAIIGIGEEWQRIRSEVRHPISDIRIIEGCTTMKDIVEVAKNVAKPGDVVLLSPACASFGMFQNYKDRGDQFRNEVAKLSKTQL